MVLESDLRLVISNILLGAGLVLGLTVAGCDRQSGQKPQGEAPQSSAETPQAQLSGADELVGALDRSRKGEAMPDVSFEAPSGEMVKLADFKGQPLLVNIWATWCGPCVAEMPTIEKLATREAGRLQVLAVSQDMKGRPAVEKWWNGQGFKTLQPYVDKKGDLGFALGGGTLPTTLLYDRDGKEIWRMVGAAHWDNAAQKKLIEEAFAE
jgi:thiol-disulfide isomerase/thioredoxin